jgi:hypothetical protein
VFALMLPFWPTIAFAEDPVVNVECLCVSSDGRTAVGLAARTWDDLSPVYVDILRHSMTLILAPAEQVGDRQKQVCAKWAEVDGNNTAPYAPSASPTRVMFRGMSKFTTESTYHVAVRGFVMQ